MIVATYGGEEWLDIAYSRAVPSAERLTPHEVIAVHQPTGNIADARNEGAERATGEWLCFLDADDELAPGYLAAMEAARGKQRDSDERTLYTPAVSYVTRGRRRPARFWPEVPLTSGNWLVIGTLIRRDLFLEVDGFRDWPHGLEDWDLWARVWKTGCRIVKVRRAVYIAHWNERSKHHTLMRDTARYMDAYNRVAASHQEAT